MIIRIFAATESATLPIWTANQGGSFAFMGTLRLYTKQALFPNKYVLLSLQIIWTEIPTTAHYITLPHNATWDNTQYYTHKL